jgi:hypothetical protein
MLFKKYQAIMAKSEKYRNRWALGLSVTLSLLIFVSFGFYKGLLSFDSSYVMPKKQVANVISVDLVASPMQNTKETLLVGFKEINKQYQKIKNSLAEVLVPFVDGIGIYSGK